VNWNKHIVEEIIARVFHNCSTRQMLLNEYGDVIIESFQIESKLLTCKGSLNRFQSWSHKSRKQIWNAAGGNPSGPIIEEALMSNSMFKSLRMSS